MKSHSVVPYSLRPHGLSLPGFSVHGIFQASILEWVAISFSRGSSGPWDQTLVSCTSGRFFTDWSMREAQKPNFLFFKIAQSCPAPCDPMDYIYSPWNSLGHNTGGGSLSLLQGIFPTQGLNPGLPHCRWILYQLSHKGSPNYSFLFMGPFLVANSCSDNMGQCSWTAILNNTA